MLALNTNHICILILLINFNPFELSLSYMRDLLAKCPASSVPHFVLMVHEGDHVLVPAWQIAVDLHGDKLG